MEAMAEEDCFSESELEYLQAKCKSSSCCKRRKTNNDDDSGLLEGHYSLRRAPTAADIGEDAIANMKARMRANQQTAEEVIYIMTQLQRADIDSEEISVFEQQLKTITDAEKTNPSDRGLHGGVNIFELIEERNFDQDYDWERGNYTLNTLVVKRSPLSGFGLFYMGSKELPPCTTVTWYPGPTVHSSNLDEDNNYVIQDNFNTGWLYDASSCLRRRLTPLNNQGLAHMCNSAHPELPPPYDVGNCSLVSSSRMCARVSLRSRLYGRKSCWQTITNC